MKSIEQMLDRQYALMRLMIQKMEIVSEADQYDEGIAHKASVEE